MLKRQIYLLFPLLPRKNSFLNRLKSVPKKILFTKKYIFSKCTHFTKNFCLKNIQNIEKLNEKQQKSVKNVNIFAYFLSKIKTLNAPF